MLPLLALLFAGVAYYGARGSLANFVLAWQHAYGTNRGGVSLIVTASFLSIGAAQIVGGRLLERIDAWKVLSTGLVLGVVGYGPTELLTAFAATFEIADFSTVPPRTALAQRAFKTGGFGLVLGLIGAGHQVGSAVGSALGGYLVRHDRRVRRVLRLSRAGLLRCRRPQPRHRPPSPPPVGFRREAADTPHG